MTSDEAVDDVIVRDARDDERGAIRALTLQAYGEYATVMTPAAWAELEGALHTALASDGPVERIVAARGGAILGSVHLYPPATDAYHGLTESAPWPELRLLAVSSNARGLGIGARLVDACVRRARDAGAESLGLHTSESMRAAMRLYERLGFIRAPEHDFRAADSELVQGYRLPL